MTAVRTGLKKSFGRVPDARQMAGSVEWHHGADAGVQLWQDAANAGHGTLTLIVTEIVEEQARLLGADRAYEVVTKTPDNLGRA